jgi:hypothetical protein
MVPVIECEYMNINSGKADERDGNDEEQVVRVLKKIR